MSTALLAGRLTARTELGPKVAARDPQILGKAIAGSGAAARIDSMRRAFSGIVTGK